MNVTCGFGVRDTINTHRRREESDGRNFFANFMYDTCSYFYLIKKIIINFMKFIYIKNYNYFIFIE